MTNAVQNNDAWREERQRPLHRILSAVFSGSHLLTRGPATIFKRAVFAAIAVAFCALSTIHVRAGEAAWNDAAPLSVPAVGTHGLRVLSPNLLELFLVTTKQPDPARLGQWDFIGANFQPNLPSANSFKVLVNGTSVPVQKVGFKRRAVYAPLRHRDLRIGNSLYLELGSGIGDGQSVEVQNPSGDLWSMAMRFTAQADAHRLSPAIHVNQVGYMPGLTKKAMVGYYLGSMGEMKIAAGAGFRLIDETTGAVVFQGALVQRPDKGYTYDPSPYQQVYEADFSAFKTPGEYRMFVPGLGISYPFLIDEGVAASFARAYALGLYHQRCGMKNELPFSRFTHDACHIAPADVPTMQFQKTQELLAQSSGDNRLERQTAPQLRNVDSSLYPFVNRGKIDVSGGHHDAGDYSKYTINSAGLIHHLVFAADAFSGAGQLDNMGVPESGDGKSDLLQEAKWEADFLAKMQDADGGFYFLVYPRERRYEDDVLPEHGDPQVVWPKTTTVTAAAVAALAEAGSSPLFQQQFPAEAALYLSKAKAGWEFLERAITKHGKDGSFQAITHYGKEFIHDDELAWAAAALFAATGEAKYHDKLKSWFDPSSTKTRRWDWWRLFEAYGGAVRTYAFAARTGRLAPNQLDPVFLAKCEAEIQAAAQDHMRFARESAYGTSFPDSNKQYRSAGWYFSMERAFDLAVAHQLNGRADFLEALVSNMNYEGGCNPINMPYVTGIGYRRQQEIVHHYSQNDHRALPPTGLPIGNIQPGFQYLYHYKHELTALSFPADGAATAPYPYYDRWADSFNTVTEFVVVDQARGLAATAYLMGRSAIKDQPWRATVPTIRGVPSQVAAEEMITATLEAPGIDLAKARIVWEARDQQPYIGPSFKFAAKNPGEQWIEVEAQLPDGRRLSAVSSFIATVAASLPPNSYQSAPVQPNADMVALFHLDHSGADTTGRAGTLQLHGNARFDSSNVGWMTARSGAALAVRDLGDKATVALPSKMLEVTSGTSAICIEAMVFVNSFKAYNRGTVRLVSLYDSWNAYLELAEDAYAGPQVRGGTGLNVPAQTLAGILSIKQWHHLSVQIDRSQYTLKINGRIVATAPTSELANWGKSTATVLELGNFDGWIDEVVVRRVGADNAPSASAPQVSITTPQNGTTWVASKSIVLAASASSSSTAIKKVEFYAGAVKLAESTTSPYQFTWANAPVGKHSIVAKAFDLSGSSASSAPVNITVSSPSSNGGAPAQNVFLGEDNVAQGNWKGVYGSEAFQIIGSGRKFPANIVVRTVGKEDYTWASDTSDVRALGKTTSSGRVASCWYAPTSFDVEVDLADGRAHRLTLYAMDWDRLNRRQSIEIFDASSGTLLDAQIMAEFQNGRYLTWQVAGKIRIRLTNLNGPNSVLMGLFIDPATAPVVPETGTLMSVRRSSTGEFEAQVSGPVGQRYQVEASSDLQQWTPISTVAISGGPVTFVDGDARNHPIRFYRVIPVE